MNSRIITIRPHHLLCLIAFRGQGYSDHFNAKFAQLKDSYLNCPDCTVEVVVGPDDACRCCPHLGPQGCRSQTDGPEQKIQALDRKVITALGIGQGRFATQLLRQKVASLSLKTLHELCSECSWYTKTSCQDIIIKWRLNLK